MMAMAVDFGGSSSGWAWLLRCFLSDEKTA